MELIVSPLAMRHDDPVAEVVEHKGIGHPDTICDALAEAFGVALGQYYVEHFGRPLHFNVDKALLVAGASSPAYGGGRVIEPMQMILGGRATRRVRGEMVPVEAIAVKTSKAWMRSHLHAVDPESHVNWQCLVRAGSDELVDLFASGQTHGAQWLANDTSVGAGYAPHSPLERAVLAAAARLRSLARECPEVGEDTKVMGLRLHGRFSLTVACAFIGGSLTGLDHYEARREHVRREVALAATDAIGRDVVVELNTADDRAAGRAYVTVTGTSAEAGDDGQVGRGNRVSGLITPCRPMSMEAAAGKNPMSHVGKLYNVAAHRIAASVVAHVPVVREAHCFMLSRIGRRVDEPVLVDVRIRTRDENPPAEVTGAVRAVALQQVAALGALARRLAAGAIHVY